MTAAQGWILIGSVLMVGFSLSMSAFLICCRLSEVSGILQGIKDKVESNGDGLKDIDNTLDRLEEKFTRRFFGGSL